MSIYSTWDAYDHLEIGRKIGYYKGDPIYNKIADGYITDIIECDNFDDECRPCNVQISIDGKPPECFRYGDKCGIRYVIKKEFIDEDEFTL